MNYKPQSPTSLSMSKIYRDNNHTTGEDMPCESQPNVLRNREGLVVFVKKGVVDEH
jgi:hypothetical protein